MLKSTTPATPRPRKYGFPRSARIREGREFALLREEGRVAQGQFLRVSALRTSETAPSRFGIITSRRVGGAVARNRVRRRLREICRLHRDLAAPGFLVVIVAKSAAAASSFAALREEWLLLTRRLSILPGS